MVPKSTADQICSSIEAERARGFSALAMKVKGKLRSQKQIPEVTEYLTERNFRIDSIRTE
jgi:hypothetical protein